MDWEWTCHIKIALVQVNASQLELSEAIGVSRNTITDLARNKTRPHLSIAYDVVDWLNDRGEQMDIPKRWTVNDIWERKISKSDVQDTR
ncbi:helix-turn-helix domain-containing protein [Cohnella sp. GCM10020058]|uniref:helix-turn-helix domain-containing protein n=1 Tax=Cohnella sp. GCM10020058 TaxID=3317330 RepID=UPI0036418534